MARAKSRASSPKLPPSRLSAPYAGDEASLVVMGRIVGAHGVKGWVKVKPFTEEPSGLAIFESWVVAGAQGWREVAVEDFELYAKGPVAKLAGCDDRGAAEALRGADVAVPRERLGEAEEGTMYRVDLLGLEVVDEGGGSLGRVESFFEAGDTSVMVVGGGPPRGQDRTPRQRMIPFVADYVKSVDRGARRITVDWKADYDS